MGGKFHLKLNISLRPIANKYHEGKMKRTLKRGLKVFEIAERKVKGTSLILRLTCVSMHVASWCQCHQLHVFVESLSS